MCNQRERLIGFIYNEGEAAELREVQQHLEECAECRTEVGALRNVREDLLAWDVPPAESVWRPFTPKPAAPVAWWRQAPAWTMAAAASVMLIAGFTGGAVAHSFAQEPTVATTPANSPAQVPVALTAAELAAVENKLRAEFRSAADTLDAKLVRVSGPAQAADNHAALTAEIAMLRDLNAKLVQIVNGFDAQWEKVFRTVETNSIAVNDKVRNLQQAVQQIAQSK